jgi:hypothetical protein
MELITFQGRQCEEKPISLWQHLICSHLRSIVSAPGSGSPFEVVKIFVGASKSSESFVFIGAAVPQLSSLPTGQASCELSQGHERINCDTCWSSLYAIDAL